MGNYDFQEVEVANGGWAKFTDEGVTYIGEFMAYNRDGGTTFDGDPCDELVILTEDDETVRVTLDKGALRDAVQAAQANHGDVLRIERGEDAESKGGRTYQTFKVAVARGAAKGGAKGGGAAKGDSGGDAKSEAPKGF